MIDLHTAFGGFAALQQISSLLSITLQPNTETNVLSLLENETLQKDIFLGLKYRKKFQTCEIFLIAYNSKKPRIYLPVRCLHSRPELCAKGMKINIISIGP